MHQAVRLSRKTSNGLLTPCTQSTDTIRQQWPTKKSILCPWTSIVYRELGTKNSARLWALASMYTVYTRTRIVHARIKINHDFWKTAREMGTFGPKVKCNIPAFSRFRISDFLRTLCHARAVGGGLKGLISGQRSRGLLCLVATILQ